ncbi:MAG: hypothetical protein ACOYN6_03320 [Ignavibacteria bacterium]
MLGIFIVAGLFFGILIPTPLISALPGVTMKILELFKFYKKGNLNSEVSDYITGSGMHRTAKVYKVTDEYGNTYFANGKVFGYFVLILMPISLATTL